MHELQGQLAKKIMGQALPPLGALYIEHEIPLVDAQAGDVYFEPLPGKTRERAALGWLGKLTREACLLEMIQSTPGPWIVRSNVRKQLTLDHARALDARKQKRRRPILLRLWMLSAGSPRTVLKGYQFRRVRGWPPGFWVRSRLDAVGIVVLSALPRQRETLLLRLLGRGRVQQEAIEDLKALPETALEREIALAPLVALRMEMAQDRNPNQEEKAFFMATHDLYAEWEQRTKADARAEGRTEGVLQSLEQTYARRFGPMPKSMRQAIAKWNLDGEPIGDWVILFATGTAKEIAAAVRKGSLR